MSSALPDAVNYHRWLLNLMQPYVRGSLLEVGLGHGQYTTELAKKAERVLAVDCDARCVADAPALPANVRLAVADATSSTFLSEVGEAAFDIVVCLNVLEHLGDDVAVLIHLRRALRPGGQLLLVVPAHQALFGPMDEMAGHKRRYSRQSMSQRLTAAGFTIAHLRCINPLGGLGWWVNSMLFRPRDLSAPMINRQILWFDRWVLPLSKLLTPLTQRVFGQSVWARAVNPDPAGA